jgi:carbonic anhydrase
VKTGWGFKVGMGIINFYILRKTKRSYKMRAKILALSLCAIANFAFASGDTHWGYTGHEGPEHWGELSEKFQMCGIGKNQSPINITASTEAELAPITFNYTKNATEMLNNGHTIQVNVADGDRISIEGNDYWLKQFHFHTPSENHIDGKSFPLEAHFVHADRNGNLAVIGVMFKEGAENKTLAKLWNKMPKEADKNVPCSATAAEINALLPKNRDYYRFNGSLTTPPCSEGVKWMVLKEPLTISKAQVEEFLHIMHHPNNRPIQAINARPVLK